MDVNKLESGLSILPWKEGKGVGTGLGNESWPMRLLALEWFFILRIREAFGKLRSIKEELADTYDKKNHLENKGLSCKGIKDSKSLLLWLHLEEINRECNLPAR